MLLFYSSSKRAQSIGSRPDFSKASLICENGLEPKKPVVRGQRRGVNRFDNRVFIGVDQLLFFLGVVAPQHENDRLIARADGFDNGVGELFPALAFVRIGLAAPGRFKTALSSKTPWRAQPIK